LIAFPYATENSSKPSEMSVAILLVTHEHIGNNMLNTATAILNGAPDNTACIEVPMDSDIIKMKQKIASVLDSLSTDEGVLMLADSYGSTPFNLATAFIEHSARILISGLNLPMLIRILNYRQLSLDELKHVAIEGGRRGITTI